MAVVVPKHNTGMRSPRVGVWVDVRGWHSMHLVKKKNLEETVELHWTDFPVFPALQILSNKKHKGTWGFLLCFEKELLLGFLPVVPVPGHQHKACQSSSSIWMMLSVTRVCFKKICKEQGLGHSDLCVGPFLFCSLILVKLCTPRAQAVIYIVLCTENWERTLFWEQSWSSVLHTAILVNPNWRPV